jgi:alpha-1,2-mannosyltransferase
VTRLLDLAARAEALLRRREVVLVLLLALAIHCGVIATRRMGDFRLYHQAAERIVAGEPIYRLEDPHRYLYAPVVTFVFVPLAFLPRLPAAILWYALTIALLLHSVRISERLVYGASGRAPPGFRLVVLLCVLRFADNNLGHGQINVLLLWLVLVAYDAAARGRLWSAGFALAAAVFTKFFPLVFLLHLALARRWRFLGTTSVALGVLFLAPALWWGDGYFDVLGDWVAVLRAQAGHYDVANKINQSISAFTHRLFRPHAGGAPLAVLDPATVATITLALHVAALAALVHHSLFRRDRTAPPAGRDGEELALYLLYATVASHYSWKYYFIDLLLPTVVVFRRAAEGRQIGGAWILGLAFVANLLPGLRLFGKAASIQFQLWSFHFLSVVLLFAAIAWLSREPRSTVSTGKEDC